MDGQNYWKCLFYNQTETMVYLFEPSNQLWILQEFPHSQQTFNVVVLFSLFPGI